MNNLFDTSKVSWGKDGKFSLTIRGISDEDLIILFSKHRTDLEKAFDMFEGANSAENKQVKEFGWEILSKFPEMVALLIALAADMPDRVADLRKVPLPVKLQILEEIYRMTIDDCGGLSDFLERLFAILRSMKMATSTTLSEISQKNKVANTGS